LKKRRIDGGGKGCCENFSISDHWLNDPKKKNLLFSVVAIGQLLGTLPIILLMRKIGFRYIFPLYGILTAIATLATPLAVELGHLFVAVMRILAAVIALPLAGVFCELLGWRSLYCLLGIFGFLSTVLLRVVSAKELRVIRTGKEGVQVRGPVPYMAICKDPRIHAILLLAIGVAVLYTIQVMGIHVANTGVLTALPQALGIALKLILGPVFDISTFISERSRLLILAFLTQGNPGEVLTQVAYCALCAFIGSNAVGGLKCVARQHVHFVLVCVTIGECATAFVVPAIVAIACPHNTIQEVSHNVFLVISTIPYMFLATSEPAPWTKSTPSSTSDMIRTSQPHNAIAK
uniref:MFS domain-containing protein n=1 Tax=Angiostrongylus costaricensis TaxID=334426 RepID=A0A158PLW6_ANGCS